MSDFASFVQVFEGGAEPVRILQLVHDAFKSVDRPTWEVGVHHVDDAKPSNLSHVDARWIGAGLLAAREGT